MVIIFSESSISSSTKYQATVELAGSHNYHFTPTTKGGYWRPIPLISHEGPLQVDVLSLWYVGT